MILAMILMCVGLIVDLAARSRPFSAATIGLIFVVIALVIVCLTGSGVHVWR